MINTTQVKSRRFVALALCLCVLIVILFAGLRPFQFRPTNSVEWKRNPDGIQFQRWGIAYSEEKLKLGEDGLTIELVAEALRESNHSIAVLLELFEDGDSRWLMVGQWRSDLIIRGTEESSAGGRKYQEIGVAGALTTGSSRHLVIASGKDGTSIYVDGILMKSSYRPLSFGVDKGREGYLALGNFSGGDDQWFGILYRLALYRTKLDSAEVLTLYNYSFTQDKRYNLKGVSASHKYSFHRGKDSPDDRLVNQNGSGGDISIPANFIVRQKAMLKPPWDEFKLSLSYLNDVVINLLGFIPLGYLFALFLYKYSRLRPHIVTTLVLTFGFSTSLIIEILQTFMPSRSSSAGDLLFNTVGTVTGIILTKRSMVPKR